MRPQRRKRSSRRLHPNIEAWLTGSSSLPIPSEAIILLLDPEDERQKLWKEFRPNETYEEPITYLIRIEGRGTQNE